MSATPEFTRPAPRHARDLLRLAGWLAVPLLLSILVLQVLLADRARLAADPVWRPRIAALCQWLGCTLPAWHEPAAFQVTARDLRPHPGVPGVLLVTATFRNGSAYAQDWPILELSLGNLDGEPLGLRRFTPAQYLGAAPAPGGIGPGQSASITLEILDPGKRAVSFEFAFY